MMPHELQQFAAQLLAGQLSIEEFVRRAGGPTIADVGDAQVDLDRHRRCGFPEVVFAQGKTVAALERIFEALLQHEAEVLATRMSVEQADELLAKFPAGRFNKVGRTFRISPPRLGEEQCAADNDGRAGRVTIVTAGTSDLPVAEEARETALWTGAAVNLIQDVGVAGPHRLAANLPSLQDADAVVVVGRHGRGPAERSGRIRRVPP